VPRDDGRRLRELAWNLEKTRTDMYVASALLDVAGPRTTIRPVAGLPLPHVDHPELAGIKQVIKSVFDKVSAPGSGERFLPAGTGGQGRPAVQGLEVPDDGG
jgi:hypothetical protein